MRNREVIEAFENLQIAYRDLELMIKGIETALIVRDPGTALSADAYEGLRRQVVQISSQRRQHISNLLDLVDAVDKGATVETLRLRAADFLAELGLTEIDVSNASAHPDDVFDELSEGLDERSAWIHNLGETYQVVRKGIFNPPPKEDLPEPDVELVEDEDLAGESSEVEVETPKSIELETSDGEEDGNDRN